MTWKELCKQLYPKKAYTDDFNGMCNAVADKHERAILKAFADELKARLGVVSDTDILAKHINQLLTEAGVER